MGFLYKILFEVIHQKFTQHLLWVSYWTRWKHKAVLPWRTTDKLIETSGICFVLFCFKNIILEVLKYKWPELNSEFYHTIGLMPWTIYLNALIGFFNYEMGLLVSYQYCLRILKKAITCNSLIFIVVKQIHWISSDSFFTHSANTHFWYYEEHCNTHSSTYLLVYISKLFPGHLS